MENLILMFFFLKSMHMKLALNTHQYLPPTMRAVVNLLETGMETSIHKSGKEAFISKVRSYFKITPNVMKITF